MASKVNNITMASCSEHSSDSDDENVILAVNPSIRGSLAGYSFEPQATGLDICESSDSDTDSDRRRTEVVTRGAELLARKASGVIDWCRCGNCQIPLLVTEKEYTCCQEYAPMRGKSQSNDAGMVNSLFNYVH